jgi:predicted nucleic acid-binding protein
VNSEGFVLDTSSILTLIEDEEGAERVDQVLRTERVWIPWIVLLEVNYITRQERGETEADRRYALMKQLPVTILWDMDEPTLLTAARIKASYHLSLANAVIAALAMQMNAALLHKDPEYEALAGQIYSEALPYK